MMVRPPTGPRRDLRPEGARAFAATARRRPRREMGQREAAAGSVSDASLRPLARALLAIAEELVELEGNKG